MLFVLYMLNNNKSAEIHMIKIENDEALYFICETLNSLISQQNVSVENKILYHSILK